MVLFYTPDIYSSVVPSAVGSAVQFYLVGMLFSEVGGFYSFLVVAIFVFAI